MQHATAVGQAECRFVAGIDLVLVVVAEIGTAGAPGALVERQADLFVDADFRLEVRVTDQVAATDVHFHRAATRATAVQQVVGVGLVQVRGFVGPGDAALDAQLIGDLVRGIEARAPVAAKFAVMVETHAGSDDGFGTGFDIVLDVERIAVGRGFGFGPVSARQRRAAVGTRVPALRAQRTRVIE